VDVELAGDITGVDAGAKDTDIGFDCKEPDEQ
jgi:hypothetical protein